MKFLLDIDGVTAEHFGKGLSGRESTSDAAYHWPCSPGKPHAASAATISDAGTPVRCEDRSQNTALRRQASKTVALTRPQ